MSPQAAGQADGELRPRNEIEACHLEAICRFGHSAIDFTFQSQLERIRQIEKLWSPEREAFWRSFSSWSPSRFELIELIPFYEFAGGAVRTMRDMSADRYDLPGLEFVIGTDPSRAVNAFVDDSATAPVPINGAMRRIVWMNVGLMNFFKDVAKQVIWTLIYPRGGIAEMLADVAGGARKDDRPTRLAASLLRLPFDARVHLPGAELDRAPAVAGSALSRAAFTLPPVPAADFAFMCLMRSFTTFVVGHEIGHVYVGHTGTQDVVPVIISEGMDRVVKRESEADAIGLSAVWDGMAHCEPSMSIDITWLGPVLFLSSMMGFSLLGQPLYSSAGDEAAFDRALFWHKRLFLLVKGLMNNLAENGFDDERVRAVADVVPSLACAVVEWLRLGSLDEPADEPFNLIVYDDLVGLCD